MGRFEVERQGKVPGIDPSEIVALLRAQLPSVDPNVGRADGCLRQSKAGACAATLMAQAPVRGVRNRSVRDQDMPRVESARVGRVRMRAGAKERDLKWERIDVLSFADELAMVVETKFKGKKIEFVKDFDFKIGKFEVDAGIVHSALINILENAVDACARDKAKKSHKIIFGVRQDKKSIIFEVFDNGTGMDRETQDKLFTAFVSSKGDKGTGLGLFISNKIIEQHGGNITVKSTEGEGTLFSIRIPKILPESAKVTNDKAAAG